MNKILLLVFCSQTFCFPKKGLVSNDDHSSVAPIKNARYYFSADVDDEISDLQLHRKELRFGNEVVGKFSYNDGFVTREVVYVADENGYRVISDKMEHIPQSKEENYSFNSTHSLNGTSQSKSSKLPGRRPSHTTNTKA